MTTTTFDVFLSHNSNDKENVRRIGKALIERGLKVWLDEWELIPGRPWQEEIEKIISTTKSAMVLVGKDGFGPWEESEMRGCLNEFVKRKLPIIPVLLPNAAKKPDLPVFLNAFTWVDLRNGFTDKGLDRIEWGITGKKPEKNKHSSRGRSAVINQDGSSQSETLKNFLEDHYDSIINAITRGRMVPFLGSDINLCDRIQANGEILEPWKSDSSFPPSGKELANYLAQTFPPQLEKIISYKQDEETGELKEEVPLINKKDFLINKLIHEHAILIYPDSKGKGSLHVGGEALQYLSQYAYLTQEGKFYDQLHNLKLGSQPNQLHKFFASLPAIMREKGYYPPYPLIVTTNYDCALETAFNEAKEEFDLVFYSNILETGEQDRFVHREPDDTFTEIQKPNEYKGLSFEQRPVILKLYGSVDQIREREGENVVITEEHYIEYLVSRNLSNLLPATILRKLRSQKPNILFLGYSLGDWNQRIILHRIWSNLTSRKRFKWWAIQPNTDPLAQKLWESYYVDLYNVPLREFITKLKQRVLDIPAKGG